MNIRALRTVLRQPLGSKFTASATTGWPDRLFQWLRLDMAAPGLR